MKNILVGAILVAVGSLAIAIRKKFAHDSVLFQNMTFGFHFGEKERSPNKLLISLFGLILIVLGTLVLFGVVKWK
jgi:hypothetical protein